MRRGYVDPRRIGGAGRAAGPLFAGSGVAEGSTVAIGFPKSVGSWRAFRGLGGRAVPLPISDRLPPLERSAIVDLAGPSLIVGVPQPEAGAWRAMESVPGQLPAGSFTPGVSPAWKVVTSGGSTGRPKLIAATAPALLESVAGLGAMVRLPSDETVVATGPLSHNAPFVVTTAAMLLGNHVVLPPQFDPAETLQLVERHRASWLNLVPTMMLRIWRLPNAVRLAADVSSLKVAFHLAAPCPPWLKQAWIDWLGPDRVLELYAGTELQAVTVISGTEWLAHRGSASRPVLGEIQIRDPNSRPVPAGEEGEIWMRRGPGTPSPYRYIGATARSAPDGWESLGDIGRADADGYVDAADRLADMILVGGATCTRPRSRPLSMSTPPCGPAA